VQILAGAGATAVIAAPATSDTLRVTVVDGQGHKVTAAAAVNVVVPTMWGVAIEPDAGTKQTRQQAYDAYVTRCGVPDYLRTYLNSAESTVAAFPTTWPAPHEVTDWATRGTFESAKLDMAAAAAGKYDAVIRAHVAGYRGKRLKFAPWHEPEDDIEAGTLKLADWRAGVTHLVTLFASINNPLVELWVVLMDFTFDPASKRNPDDYWVPGVDGYGIDGYDVPSARHDGTPSKSPSQIAGAFSAWLDGHVAKLPAGSKPVRKGWIEVGSVADFTDATKRPKWIASLGPFVEAENFTDVSYFSEPGPKGDWPLHQVVHRTAYYPAKPLGTVTSTAADTTSPTAWRKVTGR
jgi:hypothetical protein